MSLPAAWPSAAPRPWSRSPASLAALEAASEPVIDLPLLLGAEDHPAPEDVALSGSVDAELPL